MLRILTVAALRYSELQWVVRVGPKDLPLWVVCGICEHPGIEAPARTIGRVHNNSVTVRVNEVSIQEDSPLCLEELSI